MRLTVLGGRAGMPADGEASSGYLVEAAGTRLLLDCGPGVATVLSGRGRAAAPDAVVITHLHLDHCHDLLPLGKSWVSAALGHRSPGTDPAGSVELPVDLPARPLLVPPGASATLARWAELFPVGTEPLLDRVFEVAYAVREYRPGDTVRVGGVDVSLIGLRHAAPNCGVRVDTPTASLAYTGDTGPTPALTDLAHGVDLLLAECTLDAPDDGLHGHLCAADAGRAAARAGVGELVLTHLASSGPQWRRECHAAAAAEFSGPVRLTRPLDVLTVSRRDRETAS